MQTEHALYVVIAIAYALGFLMSVAYCTLAIERGAMPPPKYKTAILLVSVFWFLLTIRCTNLVIKGYRQL